MKGKLGGFILTAVIVMVIVAISYRVAFLKKLVYGA
jgi:hypothetical protein